jgi:hypothetical protein
MNSEPESVLEVHTLCVHGSRQHVDLFVLHVYALNGSYATGELKELRLRERLGCEPTTLLSPR